MHTLDCPSCGKTRHYKDKYKRAVAIQKNTVCYSCRSIMFNKRRIGRYRGAKNPAWTGVGDIPGKVLSRLRNGALDRNLSFDISLEDVYNVWEQQKHKCALSGVELSWDKDASVDRIDSTKGYSINNIQIVHKTLNIMKRDIPNGKFIDWCKAVAKHN